MERLIQKANEHLGKLQETAIIDGQKCVIFSFPHKAAKKAFDAHLKAFEYDYEPEYALDGINVSWCLSCVYIHPVLGRPRSRLKRVPFRTTISTDTLAALGSARAKTGKSFGQIIDTLVEEAMTND